MSLIGLIFGTKRSKIGIINGVGGVTIDAVISESHSHNASATENPIETGSVVTDHVTLRPIELSLDGIITDTPVDFSVYDNVKGLISTVSSIFGKKSRSLEAHDAIVKLWKDRIPFKVVTGLKVYDNMILEDYTVNREAETGKAIKFTAKMKQITFAYARTTGGGATSGIAATDVEDLAAATAEKGGQSVEKASEGSIFGGAISGSALTSGSEALFTIFAGLA